MFMAVTPFRTAAPRLVDRPACPEQCTAQTPSASPHASLSLKGTEAVFPCAATEGGARLAKVETAEGGGAMTGRLEVYAGGGWGTVCSASASTESAGTFSASAAGVACRQMGFPAGFQIQSHVCHCLDPRPRPQGCA